MNKENLKKLSVFNATVEVNGKTDSIYNHINKSLRVVSHGKVKNTTNVNLAEFFVLGGVELNMEYLTCFAKMLWVKFFKENIDCRDIVYAVTDMRVFEKEPYNSIKFGIIRTMQKREIYKVVEDCRSFVELVKEKSLDVYINSDTLEFTNGYLIHPVSCDGNSCDLLSEMLSKKYPDVINSYEMKCKQAGYGRMNMGTYTDFDLSKGKHVINIFCIESLDKTIFELKNFKRGISKLANELNDIQPIIPHKLGLNISDSEWSGVVDFIDSNFKSPKYL